MSDLYQKHKIFFLVLIVLAIGFLLWYFHQIVIFIIVAGVISIIGSPLVELLDRIRIGRIRFPHVLSVILTLLLILAVIFSMIGFFVPLVIKEANLISNIDVGKLVDHYEDTYYNLIWTLRKYGIMVGGGSPETWFKDWIIQLLDFNLFSDVLTSIIQFTGNFFFFLVSILFLSFFFLYDVKMLPRFILLLVPGKYTEQVKNVMIKSRTLLSRYFIGLFIQILTNIASYALVLSIIGVKGALVIAFFAGIVIIIPYLGGIISMIMGVLLGVTGVISDGHFDMIFPMTLKILLGMLIVQTLDNNLFQPFIQGKSVKAHPAEIFIVVLAAASIGGIPGMIVAVPAYGFLKIIATEFLSQFKIIQQLKE
jgi:predicted PurR-regulated permease PerM